MNIGQTIRGGTFWLFGSNMGGRLLEFAIGIVLARLLVPADFGMLVTIQVFTGVAGFFAGGGMGEALVQAREVKRNDYNTVFTVQLGVCILLFLGFFFGMAPLMVWMFEDPLYGQLMQVSALNFLIRPFANIGRSKLNREMRYRDMALIRLAGIVLTGAFSIYLATLALGPWALLLGGLAGAVVVAIIFMWSAHWVPRIHFEMEVAKRLGSYGIKISATGILGYLRNEIGNLIISRALGASMIGLFNKGSSLAQLPVQAVAGSAYPTVFRALSTQQDEDDKSRYIFLRTMTLTSVYALPFAVGLFWLAEPFIGFVYGEKWLLAAVPLQILCLVAPLRIITNASGAVIAARALLGKEVVAELFGLFLLIAGTFYGVQWGLAGAAWGAIPSVIFMTWRLYSIASRELNLGWGDLLKALMPAAMLNTALCALLAALHFGLPTESDWGTRLLVLGGAGAGLYTLLFLYSPIEALSGEARRWKKLLHLPHSGGQAAENP